MVSTAEEGEGMERQMEQTKSSHALSANSSLDLELLIGIDII